MEEEDGSVPHLLVGGAGPCCVQMQAVFSSRIFSSSSRCVCVCVYVCVCLCLSVCLCVRGGGSLHRPPVWYRLSLQHPLPARSAHDTGPVPYAPVTQSPPERPQGSPRTWGQRGGFGVWFRCGSHDAETATCIEFLSIVTNVSRVKPGSEGACDLPEKLGWLLCHH